MALVGDISAATECARADWIETVTTEIRVGPCAVVRVVDGDTVDVKCEPGCDRVRLLRIDTPERGNPNYKAASEALAKMTMGKDVYLEFEDPGKPRRGGFKRLLAYVYIGDLNINVEMVRRGWSAFWTKYGEGRFRDEFVKAENEARRLGVGIWRVGIDKSEENGR